MLLRSSISLSVLSAAAAYCVMRDPQMHESIVVSGRTIQQGAETSRDFRRYSVDEPLPFGYVRVLCSEDAFALAVWRDPTRPELNVPFDLEASELGATVPLRAGSPESLMAEDSVAEQELAAEHARDDDALARLLHHAARNMAQSLYVQFQ